MSGVTGGIRLHRQRSIYSRINDLIRSGTLDYDKRPLWFDVYAAHPPIRDPVYIADAKPDEYGLTEVKDDVRKIFYPEDRVRAVASTKFRQYNWISSMFAHEKKPRINLTQSFVKKYQQLEKVNAGMTELELFMETEKYFEDYFAKQSNKEQVDSTAVPVVDSESPLSDDNTETKSTS